MLHSKEVLLISRIIEEFAELELHLVKNVRTMMNQVNTNMVVTSI